MISSSLSKFLQFSNSILHLKIPKKHCLFLKYCISILLDFLQYCNTAILHFWKVLQYCKNPKKVLQYWNAILQYWKSGLYMFCAMCIDLVTLSSYVGGVWIEYCIVKHGSITVATEPPHMFQNSSQTKQSQTNHRQVHI